MNSDMNKQATEKSAEAVIAKAVRYVAETQPLLDKVAVDKVAYKSAVESTVKILVERGFITPAESVKLAAQLSVNPVTSLKLVERIAAQTGADSLGKKASDVKRATGRRLDAFEALVLTGDPANINPENPSMVD